jgi:hypothetical protein
MSSFTRRLTVVASAVLVVTAFGALASFAAAQDPNDCPPDL